MKTTFFLFIITFSFCLYGHERNDTIKNKLSVSISPHHLLEFYHGPSINGGCEYVITNNFSGYSEYGFYVPNIIWSDYSNLKGFSLVQEFKFFYLDHNYVSFQFMYGRQNYWKNDSILGGQKLFYENKKEFLDLSIRFGKNIMFGKRFLVNPYLGLGIRTHRLQCSLSEDESNSRILGDWNNPKSWIQKCGNNTYLKAQVGFRIGYRIF